MSPLLQSNSNGYSQINSLVFAKTSQLCLTSWLLFVCQRVIYKENPNSVYTDFAKAFDRVDHNVLIWKPHKLGFRRSAIDWLSSFLTNRWKQVNIGNYLSNPLKVTSGVPQGSHCGPILFFTLSHCFKFSKFIFYADDLEVFKVIISVKDCQELKTDLNM